MSPGPSKSPGRKAEGVLRCGSGGGSPHRELPPLLEGGQPVPHVSLLPPPRPQPPPLPLCPLRCCSRDCTSFSPNISAKMVVLLSTQLFNAPCAYNIHKLTLTTLKQQKRECIFLMTQQHHTIKKKKRKISGIILTLKNKD